MGSSWGLRWGLDIPLVLCDAVPFPGQGADDRPCSTDRLDSLAIAHHWLCVDRLHVLRRPVLAGHGVRGSGLPRLRRQFARPQQTAKSSEEAVRPAPDALLRLESMSPPSYPHPIA